MPICATDMVNIYLKDATDNIYTAEYKETFKQLKGYWYYFYPNNLPDKDPAEQVRTIKELLPKLPAPNYATLKFIIQHLARVVKALNTTAESIARWIVYTPSFIVLIEHVDIVF